jgi:Leucine-rich repeat (LRR) protein
MSSMRFLSLGNNSLSGRIPFNIGYTLPNIETLILTSNRLDGTIPTSLQNASHLKNIYIADNMLSGLVPFFGSLPNLEILDVGVNMLEQGDWGFLSSLTNCTKLTKLKLDSNNLQGNLPVFVGNLTNSLENLWLRVNHISGPIPSEIGNLKKLTELLMGYNILSGVIPQSIERLSNLVVLGLVHNELSGQIPDAIGNLSQLNELYLAENNLSGSIPVSIGHCKQLQRLNLSYNSLVGSIPSHL